MDLRAELRSRGLQHSGLKQELVQRLSDDDDLKNARYETDKPAAEPSPKIPQAEDQRSVALSHEEKTVAAPESVASPTDPCGGEEDSDQSQKRKRRSATPLPDPKRLKADVFEPGHSSSPERTSIDKAPSHTISTDTKDAGPSPRGQSETDTQEEQSHAEDGEDTAKNLATPLADQRHTEPPAMNAAHEPSFQQQRPTESAIHPPTRALYIRELMRPLRAEDVRAHLRFVSSSAQQDAGDDAIEVFYLDPVRTHAFVVFSDTTMAIRARSALHNVVWPEECNRKPLWVDFVPPENVRGWIMEESADGPRGGNIKRWQVRYDTDWRGDVQVVFGLEPGVVRPEPGSEPHLWPTNPRPIPTGPAGNANDIPLGPRKPRSLAGHGRLTDLPDDLEPTVPVHSGQAHPGSFLQTTRSRPPISYRKVLEALATRRVRAIQSHYTRDHNRWLGREDEINRYTFESEDVFVDKGKENFVGIRPPHREARLHARNGAQPPYRPRASSPRHIGHQSRGPGPRGGRRDGNVPRLGANANDTPIGNNHRYRHRD